MEPSAASTTVAIRDGWVRLVGIPGFGLVIPRAVDVFGDIGPRDPRYWLGTVWFVALAAVIWQGNRWLLFRQQSRLSWLGQPVIKLVALVFACTIYTAPLTLAWIATWYVIAGRAVDVDATVLVALVNVICVLFVTHAYETVFLIQARESDQLRVERLQRAAATAQLESLRQQVDPHFLFNSLATLGALIEAEPARAARCCDALADMYRYLLQTQSQPLVPLRDELTHVRAYATLLEARFGGAVRIDTQLDDAICDTTWVPPCALQTLVENAVKHNRFDSDVPLVVRVDAHSDGVRVSQPLRPRARAHASLGVGLRNLDERCRLLVGAPLAVDDGSASAVGSERTFAVSLPTAEAPA